MMEPLVAVLLVVSLVTLAKVFSLDRHVQELRQEQVGIRGLLRKLVADRGAKVEALKRFPSLVIEEEVPNETQAVLSTDSETPAIASAPKPVPPPLQIAPIEREASVAPPAPPPPPLRETSRGLQILRRIWNWIVVGEEYQPPGLNMEYAVATTWLLRAGIIAIVAGVGWFLKWSVERGWIGPLSRTAFAALAGVAMLATGGRLMGRRYHLLGQGLCGGGLATLYLSMFAAGPHYALVPTWAAFALMVLVTVFAGFLAIRVDSLLVAILGIVGGFCTPFVLGGDATFEVLYSYLLVLGLGILVLAHHKAWRLLNYLGFVFTWIVVAISLLRYQKSDFVTVMTLTSLLFVQHSAIAYWHNIVRGEKFTTLEILYLVANSLVFSAIAYWVIFRTHGRPWPAVMTSLLAMFYVAHVLGFMRLRRGDRGMLVTMLALAGFYLTLTVPMLAKRENITAAWALLALMFLWVSHKVQSPFLGWLAGALYAVVLGKLMILDMPLVLAPATLETSFVQYFEGMKHRLWAFGLCIGSLWGATWVEGRSAIPCKTDEEDDDEAVDNVPTRALMFWAAVLVSLAYAQLEIGRMFDLFLLWRPTALTVVWTVAAALLFYHFLATGQESSFWAFAALVAIALFKVLTLDQVAWCLNSRGVYMIQYGPRVALARWVGVAPLVGLLFGVAHVCQARAANRGWAATYGYVGFFLLLVYSTLEVNSLLFWKLRAFQAGGVSALWATYAAVCVGVGIWKGWWLLRQIGLGLFAVVVVKVFCVDLAHTPVAYRILAFLLVGLALLMSAFVYMKAGPRRLDKTSS